MTDLIVGILALLGTLFVFFAALGMVRMTDTYLRISVTTKAATLGIGLLLVAAAVHSNELALTAKVFAIILFLLLTAPVSAHLVGRTSYFSGVKLWKKSVMDDMEGKYNPETEELASGLENQTKSSDSKKDPKD
jgi:multicomponent Na+:H+ antiporter subunit G